MISLVRFTLPPSGKSNKIIIVSTPKGMNHFYRMWYDAENGDNEYVPTVVHWSEVPGRDESEEQHEHLKHSSKLSLNVTF